MDQRTQILIQTERAKARQMAYIPSDAYKGGAARAADDGLLDRPATGGFWINATGERELAAIRRMGKARAA